MAAVTVGRLDHLGLIAGVIKDLRIIEMIDARIEPDEREHITTGEAIAGMVLNGLGFSNRPPSLTPQFFANRPMEVLFREGVGAAHFNRFKLGRSLDDVYGYGCDLLLSELSVAICQQEGIDLRVQSLDTTSLSLTGEYVPESDEQAIVITHGSSKEHRPDLKQAILELLVSQDGGVPIFTQSWDGNSSDNTIFKERSGALIRSFSEAEGPRVLVADSKLYSEDNAPNLAKLSFITRVPATIKDVGLLIVQAFEADGWQPLAEGYWYQPVDLCHDKIAQRWLVIYSEAAFARAEKTIARACAKEQAQVEKALFHLQANRFESREQAQEALQHIEKGLRYHRLEHVRLTPHHTYAKKGRPGKHNPIQKTCWQIQAQPGADQHKKQTQQQHNACFVLTRSLEWAEPLTDQDMLAAYKQQHSAEQGFRFLKEPVFFVSSLFVSKPSRIQGLLMVMTLALLVYSIAQRRLRKELKATGQTIPNQIHQPTDRPTLRWVFQLLEGINRVVLYLEDRVQVIFEGLTDLRRKILKLFGLTVCRIYQISPT